MSVQRLAAQLAAQADGALPDGEHRMTLYEVAVVPRKKPKEGFGLRVISRSDAGAYAREWRNLAKEGDDPFALTEHQERGLQDWARRLNITERDPEAIIDALKEQVGAEVSVVINKTPHNTVVKHFAPKGIQLSTTAGTLTTAGEVVEPQVARGAHEKFIMGLRGARLSLSLAAEAAYELQRDQAWTSLGYTLPEYLASPEIALSRSEFYRLVSIHERYVLEGGIDPERLAVASPNKLDIPLRAIGAGEVDAQEALDDCEALGIRDLREKYRGDGEEKERTVGCVRCKDIPDEALDPLRARFTA